MWRCRHGQKQNRGDGGILDWLNWYWYVTMSTLSKTESRGRWRYRSKMVGLGTLPSRRSWPGARSRCKNIPKSGKSDGKCIDRNDVKYKQQEALHKRRIEEYKAKRSMSNVEKENPSHTEHIPKTNALNDIDRRTRGSLQLEVWVYNMQYNSQAHWLIHNVDSFFPKNWRIGTK